MNNTSHRFELHAKNSNYHNTIYSGDSRKPDGYENRITRSGTTFTTYATALHDRHFMRKGTLNIIFAKRSVIRLEPRMSSKADTLCNRFVQARKEGTTLELTAVFAVLTVDIITN